MSHNPPYFKIAFARLTRIPLIEQIRSTKVPVIIPTGMSSKNEIGRVIDILGDQIECILSCTSTYPTSVSDMNMKKILTLKEIYGKKHRIGFSNHSPGLTFIYTAYLLGAEMIEYHITLDRSMYGSDQAASIEVSGVLKIKQYLNDFEYGLGTGAIECLPNEVPIRKKLVK